MLFIYYEAVCSFRVNALLSAERQKEDSLKTWLESMVALAADVPEKYRTLEQYPVESNEEEVVGYAPENIRPYWAAFLMLRDKALAMIEKHEIAHIHAVSERASSHPKEQCREMFAELRWLTEQADQVKSLFYTEAKHALGVSKEPGVYDVKAGYAITRQRRDPDEEEQELANLLLRSIRGIAIIRG